MAMQVQVCTKPFSSTEANANASVDTVGTTMDANTNATKNTNTVT